MNPHDSPTAEITVPPGLSNARQIRSSVTQPPAAAITLPSPPGRWNGRRSARANSSTHTAAPTSSTAASTQEKSRKADSDCVDSPPGPRLVSTYHGRNIETSSPNDEIA